MAEGGTQASLLPILDVMGPQVYVCSPEPTSSREEADILIQVWDKSNELVSQSVVPLNLMTWKQATLAFYTLLVYDYFLTLPTEVS